ncbi:MAG: CBS domain-containing protein [Acidobacteriota bacterium]|nr:CBS domain-containing protein [Acidobacteriota bacterium]MDQ7088899.1 CBS domain-containing protein [Acidobacteriota bacterium]
MGKASSILERKGREVYTIGPQEKVIDAIRLMVDKNVGSLLVMDGSEILGILTERDYLSRVVLQGRTSRETPVSEIMTGAEKIVFVDPDASVEECMAVMTEKRVRHLPVMDNGKLAGVISIGDLVRQISRDRKAQVQYLTDYIVGKYPA